jgi:hypothetical protein
MKELIIKMLLEGSPTINEIAEKIKLPEKKIRSIVYNLGRTYELKIYKNYKKTRYHIIEKAVPEEEEFIYKYENIQINQLPRVMYKADLLSWYVQNQISEIETSRQLVEIAKQNGIKIFERNLRGEVYYI